MVNATVKIYNPSSSLLNDKKYINLTNLQLTNGLYKNKLAQVYDLKFANLLCNIYSNYEDYSGTSIIKFFKPVALNGLKAKAQARQGYIGIYGSNDNVNYTPITVFKAIQNNIDFEAVWDNKIKYSYYKFNFYKGSDWACYHYINLYTYIHEIKINKVIKENINTIFPTSDKFNIYISNNNELYITNNNNSIIKIIHSHINNNVLDKFSTDNDGYLLYNNKKLPFKDILTTEDIMNIKYKTFDVYPYIDICKLANIDYSSYTSINEVISIKENREKIINSKKAIEYLFNSNDKFFVDSFISNSDMFYLIANDETSMVLLCNSEIARNSIYDNYLITENIIANSNIAMSTMMNSSRFEKVSHSMTTEFSNLYSKKAFVFGISQEWHNGTTYVVNTHGHYLSINGNYISERSSSSIDQGSDGLKYRVNKFADYVCQKNSYGNSSICYAAIFKI